MAVNVTSFSGYVIDKGRTNEDWEPAFKLAIGQAQSTGEPIYLPAGEYKIRKTIQISHSVTNTTLGIPPPIKICGDSALATIIRQMEPGENCINWTGKTETDKLLGGSIVGVCLKKEVKDACALNIRFHDLFTMDSCAIYDAETGIYAEANSSRFLNSVIVNCETGLDGRAYFNNIIIRDCYFYNDDTAIYLNGGYGVRIDGCCMQVCSNYAIIANISSLIIVNSYFEGNGKKPAIDDKSYPSSVHLDYACTGVSIHDNIFRDTKNSLSLSFCVDGSVLHNMFQGYGNALPVILRKTCLWNVPFGNFIARTIVKDNTFLDVTDWLGEEKPGLIEQAILKHSVFQKWPGASIETLPPKVPIVPVSSKLPFFDPWLEAGQP